MSFWKVQPILWPSSLRPNCAAYPTVMYREKPFTFEMVGELNVRETPVTTTFQVTARLENGEPWVRQSAQILMTDFGFTPPVIAGFIETENEVDITFEFVALPVE